MTGKNPTEIARVIEAFVRSNYLVADTRPLHSNESLIQSGIIDSTGILELITFIENRYGLRFEDNELTSEHFDSLDRIVRFLQVKLETLRDHS